MHCQRMMAAKKEEMWSLNNTISLAISPSLILCDQDLFQSLQDGYMAFGQDGQMAFVQDGGFWTGRVRWLLDRTNYSILWSLFSILNRATYSILWSNCTSLAYYQNRCSICSKNSYDDIINLYGCFQVSVLFECSQLLYNLQCFISSSTNYGDMLSIFLGIAHLPLDVQLLIIFQTSLAQLQWRHMGMGVSDS